ncbi:ABC transporter permease [Cohnella massiliensis]|uniref:ABC transporter permease n=1 Tax=Cohnella massiliensis TaxID=1816691 RepID=UPI0009BBB62B|nr:ABC transporter permease [Cohnella massiliensis]
MEKAIAESRRPNPAGQRQLWSKVALLSPAMLVYWAVFLIPAIVLLINSFQANQPERTMWERDLSLGSFSRFFSDPYFIKVIGTTLLLAVIVVAVSLVVGYLLAYHIYKAKSFVKTTLITVVLTPLFSGALLQSLGWYLMFARYGPINVALRDMGLLSQPHNFLGTYGAVVVALVHGFLPFMVLCIVNSLRSIPANVLDAASSLGASSFTAFVRVTLPLSKGGMMAGSALVFGGTLGSFATPGIVGQGKIQLLAQIIYQQAIQIFDWSFASVISIALLVVLAAVTILLNRSVNASGRDRR